MLDAAETLLEYWDANLLNHLKEVGIDFRTVSTLEISGRAGPGPRNVNNHAIIRLTSTSLNQDFLWPAMLTGFTRILETEGFLQLWDHLLSNDEPSFMCYFAVAYVINSRDTLMNNLESEIRVT